MHATHYALVQNNVAFHIRGHTFFVEDGIEKYNVFEANLAINTKCSEVGGYARLLSEVFSVLFRSEHLSPSPPLLRCIPSSYRQG